MPEFDWVVGCKPAELPEFCCLLPAPRGANVMFRFVLPTLMLMATMGFMPEYVVMVLAFRATAAAAVELTFGGGGGGVCNIIALLGESWV